MTTASYTEEQQQSVVNTIEKTLESKFNISKRSILKTYYQFQYYMDAIKAILVQFWQYDEFRIGVYIVALLSAIPVALFVLFITAVVLVTSMLVTFVWTFLVFSAITIGLMILVPLMFGTALAAGSCIIVYDLYRYLLNMKQANTTAVSDN